MKKNVFLKRSTAALRLNRLSRLIALLGLNRLIGLIGFNGFHRLLAATLFMGLIVSGCSSAGTGERLYSRFQCGACHVFNGKGGIIGPDLTLINENRSLSWIAEYISDPSSINSTSRMPAFEKLSQSDRKSIAMFLSRPVQ